MNYSNSTRILHEARTLIRAIKALDAVAGMCQAY